MIEYARNILGWADANSTEFDEATEHPVVLFMPEISKTHMGGTMRLGQRATYFTDKDCVTSVCTCRFCGCALVARVKCSLFSRVLRLVLPCQARVGGGKLVFFSHDRHEVI